MQGKKQIQHYCCLGIYNMYQYYLIFIRFGMPPILKHHFLYYFYITIFYIYIKLIVVKIEMGKAKETFSVVLAKSLAKQKCNGHRNSVTKVDIVNLKPGCHQCFCGDDYNIFNVQDIAKNPIQMKLIYQSQFDPQAIKIRNLMQRKDEHNQIKIGFQAIIEDIRKSVNFYLDSLLQDFNQKWSEAFPQIDQVSSQLVNAQQRYQRVFEQIVESNFQNGLVEQFEQCLNKFCNEFAEDPTDYLQQRINNVLRGTESMPMIYWQKIKRLQQIVTDPFIWRKQNYIMSSYLESKSEKRSKPLVMLLPEIQNKLSKEGYLLKFDSQTITLSRNNDVGHQNQVITILKQKNEGYYQIDQCRLIGVNYGRISIYSYALGFLQRSSNINIAGCESVLAFENCLILEAEGRIIRIWLNDSFKEVVCLVGSDLQYGYNQYQFEFTNGKGERVIRSAFHNQL